MGIKLIASDMDGTFLRKDNMYNVERFAKLLVELNNRQIKFVAASGRQIRNLQELFQPVLDEGHQIDYVASNGAVVSTFDQKLYSVHLTPDELGKVIDWNAKNPESAENLIIMTGEETTYISNHATPEVAAQVKLFYPNVKQVEKLLAVDEKILEVTFVWPTDEVQHHVAKLREVFGNELHATGSGFGSVDILGHGVDKATGIQVLQDYYDVLDDEVMVFGDNGNDLEMLQKYTNAYVMPNASPFMLQSINKKALADNRADGVMNTIEDWLEKND